MGDCNHDKHCVIGRINCENHNRFRFDNTPGCMATGKWEPLPNLAEICPWPSLKKPIKGESSEWICPQLDNYK